MQTIVQLDKLKSWTVYPLYNADYFTGRSAIQFTDEQGNVVEIQMPHESIKEFKSLVAE